MGNFKLTFDISKHLTGNWDKMELLCLFFTTTYMFPLKGVKNTGLATKYAVDTTDLVMTLSLSIYSCSFALT